METKGIILFFFALVLCFTLISGDLGSDKETCLKVSKKMLKGFMKLFNKCNKELKMMDLTAEEYKESIGCIIKCVMKKSDVLDEKDLISEEVMKSHIESHIPESLRKHAHEDLMKCVKLHDSLDAKDPKCKSYFQLGNCMQEAFTDICGVMPLI